MVGVCPYFSAAAGELDRVDTGLLLPCWLSEILAPLPMTGRREVDEDRGVVGVEGVVRPDLVRSLLVVAAVPRPGRELLLVVVDEDETTASLWALEWWFLATLDMLSVPGSAEAAPRYQSVGDEGSILSPIVSE